MLKDISYCLQLFKEQIKHEKVNRIHYQRAGGRSRLHPLLQVLI